MQAASYENFPGPWDAPDIHRPYCADSVEEKVFNKLELQDLLGLPLSDTLPLVAADSPVPPPAAAVPLAAQNTVGLCMLLAGCDILLTQDPALQRLARRYGTCPVENEAELAQALQLFEEAAVWTAVCRRLMEEQE